MQKKSGKTPQVGFGVLKKSPKVIIKKIDTDRLVLELIVESEGKEIIRKEIDTDKIDPKDLVKEFDVLAEKFAGIPEYKLTKEKALAAIGDKIERAARKPIDKNNVFGAFEKAYKISSDGDKAKIRILLSDVYHKYPEEEAFQAAAKKKKAKEFGFEAEKAAVTKPTIDITLDVKHKITKFVIQVGTEVIDGTILNSVAMAQKIAALSQHVLNELAADLSKKVTTDIEFEKLNAFKQTYDAGTQAIKNKIKELINKTINNIVIKYK